MRPPALFAALLLVACGARAPAPSAPEPAPSGRREVGPGDPFPAFALPDLETGLPVRLAAGKVGLVYVFATWDATVPRALAALDALHRRHALRGLVVVAVSIDEPDEMPLALVRTVTARIPVVWDRDHELADRLLRNEPVFVIVDRQGIVRFSAGGFHDDDETVFERAITPLL